MVWFAVVVLAASCVVWFRQLVDIVGALQHRQITQLRRRQLDVYVEERQVKP